jgi:hypothetical protein
MATKKDIRQLRLHFEGVPTQGHVIPATTLVQVLEGFQKIVHVIAMQVGGRSIQQRLRVSREIERKFPLICGTPEDGGYELPVTIGGTNEQLFDIEEHKAVAAKTREVFEAISQGNPESFDKCIPDRAYRSYILNTFTQMQPARHSGLVMHIEDFQNNRILDGAVAFDAVKKLSNPRPSEVSPGDFGYVAGALIEMKFNERRLRLKLLNWNKSIDASYDDEFEPILLTHPRDLIQVHGNIVFGEDGAPQSISDVDEILEIDETPIDIDIVDLKNGTHLKPLTPLLSQVTFDRESWLYQAAGPFDILLFAQTRTEIEAQLYDELEMLWSEYAKVDPSVLTQDAQQLQNDLLKAFEEVKHAN